MCAAHHNDTFPASSCKCNDLLDFFGGVRLYIEFWSRMVCLRPGVMTMSSDGSEGDMRICLCEFALESDIHCAGWVEILTVWQNLESQKGRLGLGNDHNV